MKVFATAILGCVLMGCGGSTQLPSKPPAADPLPQTPVPIPTKQVIFQGEGYQLDLRGVSSWTMQGLPQENGMVAFELVNDEIDRVRLMFVQIPYTQPLFMIVPIFFQRFAEEGLHPMLPTTIISNGVSGSQIMTSMFGLSIRTSIFATGKHVDVIGFTEPTKTNETVARRISDICYGVIQGFHITE